MYLINGLCPRTDISMGQHGFQIELLPEFKECVAACKLAQENVDNLIQVMGNNWLNACGYSRMYDPDNCGFDADPKLPPGPNTRRLHEARSSIRVTWGEWGPEHITVPGDASGLDIDRQPFGCLRRGSAMLQPHNIDCWSQVQLLLIVFTDLAHDVALFGRVGGS